MRITSTPSARIPFPLEEILGGGGGHGGNDADTFPLGGGSG